MFAMAGRGYDVVFKLKAIAAVEGGSKQAAARQFKIDAKQVREWCSVVCTYVLTHIATSRLPHCIMAFVELQHGMQ